MSFNENQINAIVDQVVRKLSKELGDLPQPSNEPALPPRGHQDDRRGSEKRYGTNQVVPGTPEKNGAPAFHR